MDNIILIGFMGVGKGSSAREIVRRSGMIAIDTDDIIESMENRKIKRIFETDGEAYFRDLEKQVGRWLEESVSNTLISTGGGFYKVENLKKIGKVVLLHAPFEAIYQRIITHPHAEKKLKKRPLFHDVAKARELYNRRLPEYEALADIVLDVENCSVEQVAEKFFNKVQ